MTKRIQRAPEPEGYSEKRMTEMRSKGRRIGKMFRLYIKTIE